MKNIAIDLLLWILASPVYAVLALRRLVRAYRFLRVAAATRIRCQCGVDISLVGVWKCSCSHWCYRGHLLTECPICGTVPSIARCYTCGLTTKLPEPS